MASCRTYPFIGLTAKSVVAIRNWHPEECDNYDKAPGFCRPEPLAFNGRNYAATMGMPPTVLAVRTAEAASGGKLTW